MNIKVGDKVKRADGKGFGDGTIETEVIKVADSIVKNVKVVWLSNGWGYAPEELVIVKKTEGDNDSVNQPSHYTYGEIETIDYIRDKLTPEQFEGYCIGNVMKYISRYRHKNGVEDLEKAKVYLEWANEAMEAESN